MSYKELRIAFRSFFSQGKTENIYDQRGPLFVAQMWPRNLLADRVGGRIRATGNGVLDVINRYSTAGLAAYISGFMTSYWWVPRYYIPNQLGLITARCIAH